MEEDERGTVDILFFILTCHINQDVYLFPFFFFRRIKGGNLSVSHVWGLRASGRETGWYDGTERDEKGKKGAGKKLVISLLYCLSWWWCHLRSVALIHFFIISCDPHLTFFDKKEGTWKWGRKERRETIDPVETEWFFFTDLSWGSSCLLIFFRHEERRELSLPIFWCDQPDWWWCLYFSFNSFPDDHHLLSFLHLMIIFHTLHFVHPLLFMFDGFILLLLSQTEFR